MNYDWWLDRKLWEHDQELDAEEEEDVESDE